jgi:hypothetical protein
MSRPSGEFGPTSEAATLTSEAPWLTGPLQNLSSLTKAPSDKDQPVFIVYDVNLTSGQFQTVFCDSGVPDFWLVTVRPATGIKLSIFLNVNASGIPIRIGGGGSARLPGMSEYLTILCEPSSSASVVTVLAVRGYKDISIDGGDLA